MWCAAATSIISLLFVVFVLVLFDGEEQDVEEKDIEEPVDDEDAFEDVRNRGEFSIII